MSLDVKSGDSEGLEKSSKSYQDNFRKRREIKPYIPLGPKATSTSALPYAPSDSADRTGHQPPPPPNGNRGQSQGGARNLTGLGGKRYNSRADTPSTPQHGNRGQSQVGGLSGYLSQSLGLGLFKVSKRQPTVAASSCVSIFCRGAVVLIIMFPPPARYQL